MPKSEKIVVIGNPTSESMTLNWLREGWELYRAQQELTETIDPAHIDLLVPHRSSRGCEDKLFPQGDILIVTMAHINDPAFVEAAKEFGYRLLAQEAMYVDSVVVDAPCERAASGVLSRDEALEMFQPAEHFERVAIQGVKFINEKPRHLRGGGRTWENDPVRNRRARQSQGRQGSRVRGQRS